ncbi:MAG TPA: hypothetical protein VIZ28_10535, partial [Chitinophagaceae bacterium]
MFSLRSMVLFLLLFVFAAAPAQKLKKGDKLILANLKTHIQYLADDKLEGRRAGSNGEKLAMEYISGQFKAIGLLPKGTDQYYQAFDINEGKQVNAATYLKINNNSLEAGKDFFPFPFSPNKKVEATPAIAIQEADMPWFIDLAETLEENKNNPHFDLEEYIRNNSKKAADRGATAVILYNSSATDDKLAFNGKDKAETIAIPAVYVSKEAAGKYFKDKTATLDIKLNSSIGEKKRTGHNVVGYI